MMGAKPAHLVLLIAIMLIITGCLGGGRSTPAPEPPGQPDVGVGHIVLTITRPAVDTASGEFTAQAIDDQATHLRIRMFRSNYELLKDFQLPDPGESKSVELTIQAGTGYTLDALIYKRGTDSQGNWLTSGTAGVILNAGRATGINIVRNQNSTVSLTLDYYDFDFTGPDAQLDAGEDYTIGVTISGGPNVFSSQRLAKVNDTPWTDDLAAWTVGVKSTTLTDSSTTSITIERSETVPEVELDTTYFYGFQLGVDDPYYDQSEGIPHIALTAPTLTRGQALRELDTTPGEGTVVIEIQSRR